jgi:hypothetical protein
MTFEEILDQALAMLQRRRRVAYRTLQVQFHLDDNALEASRTNPLRAGRRLGTVAAVTVVHVPLAHHSTCSQLRAMPATSAVYLQSCPHPCRSPLTLNAAASRCCSVTVDSTTLSSQLTRKTTGSRSCTESLFWGHHTL